MYLGITFFDGNKLFLGNVESFEFRTNKHNNYLRVKFNDGSTDMFYQVSGFKTKSKTS